MGAVGAGQAVGAMGFLLTPSSDTVKTWPGAEDTWQKQT